MIASDKLYQSILHQLSIAPVSVLRQIDTFLQKFTLNKPNFQKTKQATMALAGTWADMTNQDFDEFLQAAKQSSQEAFGREIDF